MINFTHFQKTYLVNIKTLVFLATVAISLSSKAQLVKIDSSTTLTVMSATNIIVQGGVTLEGTASIVNSGTIKLTGDWTNDGNGLINDSAGTVEFNGTSGQNITGTSPTVFHNLVINDSDDVTLGNDQSVTSTLTFTDGKINTGSNTLSLADSANAISGANTIRYVNGNLAKSFSTYAGTQSFVFEIGDFVYTPATLDIRNVSGTISVAGYVDTTDANEIYGSGIDQTKKVDHYWFINKTGGGTFDDYDLTLDFTNTTNTGTPANYLVKKFDPSTWASTTSSVTGSTIKATALTSFSDFEVGESGFVLLNLTAFIEGYYLGSSQMQPTLLNQSVIGATGAETDTILVELHSTLDTVTVVEAQSVLLMTDGTASAIFSGSVNGNSYWLAVKHRNILQTWSPTPILMSLVTNYDFTNNPTSAYGSNQKQVDFTPNKWGFYQGDINVDQNVDLLDFPNMDYDINNGMFGYFNTDLNGDGNVDLLDFPILDFNINNGIYALHP